MKIQNGVISTLKALAIPDPLQEANHQREWVFFGADNQYPAYIADLVTLSPTHEAVIEAKRTFLNGNLKIDVADNVTDKIDIEDINGKDESLEEVYDILYGDLATYEAAYLEVIYNKQHTRIVQLNHIPYNNVRVGLQNDKGDITQVFVSNDWSRKYIKRNEPTPIPTFDSRNVNSPSQVMILRVKRPNQPYYTIPSYVSSVQYILLEDDIAELNRNDVTNGFFPSMILNFFNGEPSEDDKNDMEGYINSKFKGAGGSKLMMFYGNDPEKKVQMDTHTPPNLGDYSDKMLPLLQDKILSSHRTHPSLAGISTGSGFSSTSDEIDTAFQLFLKGVIVPLQKLVINAMKKIYKFNGVEAEIIYENELLISVDDTDGKEDTANAEVNDLENVSDEATTDTKQGETKSDDTSSPEDKDNASQALNKKEDKDE